MFSFFIYFISYFFIWRGFSYGSNLKSQLFCFFNVYLTWFNREIVSLSRLKSRFFFNTRIRAWSKMLDCSIENGYSMIRIVEEKNTFSLLMTFLLFWFSLLLLFYYQQIHSARIISESILIMIWLFVLRWKFKGFFLFINWIDWKDLRETWYF